MNTIKFSHNWNNKIGHKIFTTIRGYTKSKFEYYTSKIGADFKVVLNNTTVSEAVLLNVESLEFCKIPLGLLKTDTGLSTETQVKDIFERFGIKSTDKAIILTFQTL